jgi:thiamine biosynthesis lipoprotein
MVVSADTITLVEHAVAAARATQGLYDPGIGRALARFGYDRTFDDVPLAAASRTPRPFVDGTWPAIQIDHGASTITLPAGMVFDAGGIGKGLAADLVTTEHQDRAAGILVNLGGDMRMVGAAAEPEGWIIAVEDPRDLEHEALRLTIPDGAVATSSRLKRCWTTAVGPAHHVIDPRTGRPAVTPVTAVTVVAAEAWWAETQATALFLQGPTALADVHDVEAAIWTEDGSTYATPALKELLR